VKELGKVTYSATNLAGLMLAKYEDVFFVQETVKVFEIYFHMGYPVRVEEGLG
jgi:predicted HTH transcriptional regulator